MTAPPNAPLRDALAVLDWRRRTAASYRDVRRLAATDPAAAHGGWVERRDEMFADHPASPLLPADRARFTGLPVQRYDPAFRFEVTVEPAEPATFATATGTDGVVEFDRVGRVRLGDLGSLDVWLLRSYGGGLFVPVKDALAGSGGGTYGGGRYVLDTIKGADLGGRTDPDPGSSPPSGTLVIDLNFAYSPSCAYDPAWACPLAPPGNVLAAPVPVGERIAESRTVSGLRPGTADSSP
ncbi:DUF1684 domain-containing protein [Pengzhenrongella frigida]|uniref:DUF1684 domain-containing protein n=1 Tax=Pengzhenrongella frigida TaxID=1259133 RepID=A0A4Q5N0Y2_9MICO|nr:DUF1684 domain-containing protein [Cellulomonas sp. HLT2-17]RYV51705.1 DUF1684 domain-containing protein [Cellulomonas sp. HLT2-17]